MAREGGDSGGAWCGRQTLTLLRGCAGADDGVKDEQGWTALALAKSLQLEGVAHTLEVGGSWWVGGGGQCWLCAD